MEEKIKELISEGEGQTCEFKLATEELPKNLFETVCAFLNTIGGYIILGVKDNGEIIGVNSEKVNEIKKEFTSICNNEELINPTISLKLNKIKIADKIVLYTYISPSETIETYKNKVFIRNHEGDFDISHNYNLINKFCNHKLKIYDEDRIYPYISIERDLRHDLFERVRELADIHIGHKNEHPWLKMTDLELLKSANLYRTDEETGKEGVTLAGIMLFGKDLVIKQINPRCRTDIIYRKDDLDRYDDRDMVETNLLDQYRRLLNFIAKYTMDRFTLDDRYIRISSRDVFSREMVINSLMHRDYMDSHTSRIIIYEDRLISENPNAFGTMKTITVKNYKPVQKNPTLSNFFREIGYADEMGSGTKRMTKYSVLYSGQLPTFKDGDMYDVTIPLDRKERLDEAYLIGLAVASVDGNYDVVKERTSIQEIDYSKSSDLNKTEIKIIELIKNNNRVTQEELAVIIDVSLRTIERNIKNLKDKEYIVRIGTDKIGYYKILK